MKTKKNLPVLALLMLAQAAHPAEIPSAGSQLRQIPPLPATTQPTPQLQVVPITAAPPAPADDSRARITTLHVNAARLFTEAELIAAAGFTPGAELTLAQLQQMATRIADFYHARGYFLARAYLPAQDITDGSVGITVVEAQYDKVDLRLSTKLSETLARRLLGEVKPGATVASGSLKTALLLLSDLPGVQVSSTLMPGEAVGSSDLLVDIAPGPRVTGSIDADNQGNRYTGRNHLGASININNPIGEGDQINARVLTAGSGMHYGRAAYQMQFGRTRAGVAYSSLGYALGAEFASLKAQGTARIASVFGSYPIIRSRNDNLYAQLNIESRAFRDEVDSTTTVTDKRARVMVASLSGDHRTGSSGDNGGGISSYAATWTHGKLDLQSADAQVADAATARTAGSYDKFGLSFTHGQSLTDSTFLYTTFTAQAAQRNLDISEKFQLGGANGVRAYPEGEAHGDQGYLMTLELRQTLPRLWDAQPGLMQVLGFVDTGTVLANKTPWAPGENHRTLSGAGVGLNWGDERSFIAKASLAHRIGNQKATSAPDSATRFWLQVVKYF